MEKTLNKDIDETLQGTPTMVKTETYAGKKLYLESYVC
jgi:hypothetical protein